MFFRKKNRPQSTIETNGDEGLTRGVLLAYSILLFHVALLGIIAVMMFVFGGIVHYFFWILLGLAALIVGSAYYFIKKIKNDSQALRKLLLLPEFRNRNLEIRFLGGAAALRIGHENKPEKSPRRIGDNGLSLLENTANARIRDLGELGRLYTQHLITEEEYEALKQEIMAALAISPTHNSAETKKGGAGRQ